jgi:hypothetical protein
MSGCHFLPRGVVSCSIHPEARVITNDDGLCVCTYNPPTATEDLILDAKKACEDAKKARESLEKRLRETEKNQKKKEEEAAAQFKTPEEVAELHKRYYEENRLEKVRTFEKYIASAIEDMVAGKKTTCVAQLYQSVKYSLTEADFAGIRDRLDVKGYSVIFVDKATNQPIRFSQEEEQAAASARGQRCACQLCNLDGEGEQVLRELRRIRDVAIIWWNRAPVAATDQYIEARVTIKQQPSSSVKDAPIHSHHPHRGQQEQQQQQQQHGGPRVLETLLTCPVWMLLLGFAIVPCFLPRIVFPFWQLFVLFVIVARLVRWTATRPSSFPETHCRHEKSVPVPAQFIPSVYHQPPPPPVPCQHQYQQQQHQ